MRTIYQSIAVVFITLSSTINMMAQEKAVSPVGEYYLKGVMEVASGFKLNGDSTFEFFFSYGALDRSGSGKWSMKGNEIEFSSDKKPAADFSLVRSENIQDLPGTAVKIITGQSYLASYMHARFVAGGQSELVNANSHGIIQSKFKHPDTLYLAFEFCPDKIFAWPVKDQPHNYFEFKMEPGIADVIFDHFTLHWTTGKLSGPHPLMKEKQFEFTLAGH